VLSRVKRRGGRNTILEKGDLHGGERERWDSPTKEKKHEGRTKSKKRPRRKTKTNAREENTGQTSTGNKSKREEKRRRHIPRRKSKKKKQPIPRHRLPSICDTRQTREVTDTTPAPKSRKANTAERRVQTIRRNTGREGSFKA